MEEEYQAGNYVIVGGDFNHALGEDVAEGFPAKQKFPAWVSVLTQEEMADGISIVRAKNELETPTCRGADPRGLRALTRLPRRCCLCRWVDAPWCIPTSG